jgi:hypothetical protein
MPAGIALVLWRAARPVAAKRASLRYKLLVFALVYVLPIVASAIYLSIETLIARP